MRYELTDHEWTTIRPMLPNKPRGVPRVNDRRVLNGIFWVLRSGAPWRDLPDDFGPYTTCYNRFVRWRRAGVWARIMNALAAAHDGSVQMIDTSIVRVHQHGGLHHPEPKAVHRTVTRRADQQDRCGGRYQRLAGAARTDRRGGPRQPASGQNAIRPEVRINAAGGSRL
jgi:transposase